MQILKKCSITVFVLLLALTGCTRNNSSNIAIIGGADGPTEIYLSSGFSTVFSVVVYLLLFVILGLGVAVIIKNRRK